VSDPRTATIIRLSLRRGAAALLRGRGWGAPLGALTGVFLLLQILLLLLVGIGGMQELLSSRTAVRLEFRQEAGNQEKQEFFSAVRQQEFTGEAAYITREQAYEQAKARDPEVIAFIEEFSLRNPFADTIGITLRSLDDYARFKEFTEQERWQDVLEPGFLTEITGQEQHIRKLLLIAEAGRSFTLLILALTVCAILFITVELTRHRALAQSNEVLVERLAGAPSLSILLPFAVEATILFWLAALASGLLALALTAALPLLIPAFRSGNVLDPLRETAVPLLRAFLPALFLTELACSPVIALLGSWLGIRQQGKLPL